MLQKGSRAIDYLKNHGIDYGFDNSLVKDIIKNLRKYDFRLFSQLREKIAPVEELVAPGAQGLPADRQRVPGFELLQGGLQLLLGVASNGAPGHANELAASVAVVTPARAVGLAYLDPALTVAAALLEMGWSSVGLSGLHLFPSGHGSRACVGRLALVRGSAETPRSSSRPARVRGCYGADAARSDALRSACRCSRRRGRTHRPARAGARRCDERSCLAPAGNCSSVDASMSAGR